MPTTASMAAAMRAATGAAAAVTAACATDISMTPDLRSCGCAALSTVEAAPGAQACPQALKLATGSPSRGDAPARVSLAQTATLRPGRGDIAVGTVGMIEGGLQHRSSIAWHRSSRGDFEQGPVVALRASSVEQVEAAIFVTVRNEPK